MHNLILRRVAQAVAAVVVVSVLIFAGTEILPGDVAIALLGPSASPETLEAIRQSLGLHDPAWLRYAHWVRGVLGGDLGISMANGMPVGPVLLARLGNTFFLAGLAASVAVPLSLAAGVLAAAWKHSVFDRSVNVLGLVAISLPEFFIAYLLVLVFAVQLGWAPSFSSVEPHMHLGDRLLAVALPAATLALAVFAYIMRMTRTAMLAAMERPFVEMAALKGLSRPRVLLGHALPSALTPIIQVVAFNLSYMVVGVVLVETVFVYPGIGQYLVDAVAKRDVPVVQACGLVFATVFVGINLLADLLSIQANPRLRLPR